MYQRAVFPLFYACQNFYGSGVKSAILSWYFAKTLRYETHIIVYRFIYFPSSSHVKQNTAAIWFLVVKLASRQLSMEIENSP